MKKYGVVLNGKLVRVCKSLESLMTSDVYKPWLSSCKVFEFTYNASGLPIDAREVN